MGEWEQRNHLINELAEGRELAKQLQSNLNLPCSPNETPQALVQKILASYEKAISILNCSGIVGNSSTPPGVAAIGFSESPPSLNGSPRSDQDSDPEHRNTGLGKRKSMPRWTKQVRVSPGLGIDAPLEDGFSWRKYGQKDILGAKYPRGYYRCTHRHVRGCLATKQVQRSDEDPTILEVTYRGRHTCNQSTNNSSITSTSSPSGAAADQTHQEQQNQSQEQPLTNYLRTGLKVQTEDLDNNAYQDHTTTIFPSFHFPSTSNPEHQFCSDQINLAENFTPPFVSPATSGTTSYFSVSPSGVNSSFGGGSDPTYLNFQSCETDQFTKIITSSAATSGSNSPTIGLDFQFTNAEFDTQFTFDHHGMFS